MKEHNQTVLINMASGSAIQVEHLESILRPELEILVCGKTGVGKSTLLNTLVGAEIFPTGGPGSTDEDAFAAVTSSIIKKRVKFHEAIITIYDSPGFQDGKVDDSVYTSYIQDVWSNIDLILYCIDMTTSRWQDADTKTIETLHKQFGNSFWNKCILVLTKANQYQNTSEFINPGFLKRRSKDFQEEKLKCEEKSKRTFQNFQKLFHTILSDNLKVDQRIVDVIPTIAVGDSINRCLMYVRPEMLYQDYLGELWITCLERMECLGRIEFIKATFTERIKTCTAVKMNNGAVQELDVNVRYAEETIATIKLHPELIKESESEDEPPELVKELKMAPIQLTDEQTRRLFRSCEATFRSPMWGALRDGVTTGALSGSLIGTAAIGVVGGVIGTAVGTVIGSGVGMVMGIFKVAKTK